MYYNIYIITKTEEISSDGNKNKKYERRKGTAKAVEMVNENLKEYLDDNGIKYAYMANKLNMTATNFGYIDEMALKDIINFEWEEETGGKEIET